MNARTRAPPSRSDQLSKYLKPGALAQLRDFKISARSHRIIRRVNSLSSSSWSASIPVPSVQIGDAESVDQLAKFSSPIYGSQRFGRKKLLAAKSSRAKNDVVFSKEAQSDISQGVTGVWELSSPLRNPEIESKISSRLMESRRGWRPTRNEDFQESDVWEIMTKTEAMETDFNQPYRGLLSRRLQSATRLIPNPKNSTPDPRLVQNSAPVDIPDWSKVYGKSPQNSSFADQHWYDDGCDYEDCDDDGDKMCWLPPHKWLERKHTRNHTSSFSVCEGAGRTLKGRDLTRVRDAVLIQTGFIG